MLLFNELNWNGFVHGIRSLAGSSDLANQIMRLDVSFDLRFCQFNGMHEKKTGL